MVTIYMVCGNTGAGKSTCSKQLAQKHQAACYSLDPWMWKLYGADYQPEHHDFSWITDRTARCERLIRELAEEQVRLEHPVVLDLGFGLREMRDGYIRWARKLGADVVLYYLDTTEAERRRRVKQRNREQGETHAFHVTDAMFDYVEPMFQPPTDEERIDSPGYAFIQA